MRTFLSVVASMITMGLAYMLAGPFGTFGAMVLLALWAIVHHLTHLRQELAEARDEAYRASPQGQQEERELEDLRQERAFTESTGLRKEREGTGLRPVKKAKAKAARKVPRTRTVGDVVIQRVWDCKQCGCPNRGDREICQGCLEHRVPST